MELSTWFEFTKLLEVNFHSHSSSEGLKHDIVKLESGDLLKTQILAGVIFSAYCVLP